jgi:hypothetical protein
MGDLAGAEDKYIVYYVRIPSYTKFISLNRPRIGMPVSIRWFFPGLLEG